MIQNNKQRIATLSPKYKNSRPRIRVNCKKQVARWQGGNKNVWENLEI
jgi:hypothetical protein